jgi:hypothetical protein
MAGGPASDGAGRDVGGSAGWFVTAAGALAEGGAGAPSALAGGTLALAVGGIALAVVPREGSTINARIKAAALATASHDSASSDRVAELLPAEVNAACHRVSSPRQTSARAAIRLSVGCWSPRMRETSRITAP